MIKATSGYETSDGKMHKNVADFQRAEVMLALADAKVGDATSSTESTVKNCADAIIKHAPHLAEVLSLKERKPRKTETKPRERKALGKSLTETTKPATN